MPWLDEPANPEEESVLEPPSPEEPNPVEPPRVTDAVPPVLVVLKSG